MLVVRKFHMKYFQILFSGLIKFPNETDNI